MKHPRGIALVPVVIVIVGLAGLVVAGSLLYLRMTTDGSYSTNDANVYANTNTDVTANTNSTVANANAAANTNTSDSATKDWKTYESKEFGYSIKYPKDWSIDGTRTSSAEIVFDTAVATETRYAVKATKTTQSLEQWKNSLTFETIKQSSSTTIDGEPALKVEFLGLAGTYYGVRKGDYLYQLTDSGGYMTSSGMLASFNFTNASADTTKDWKTYANTAHDYSFQYPKDWTLGDSPTSSTPSPTADHIAFDGSGYTSFRFGARVVTVSGCSTLKACAEANRLSFGSGEQTTGLAFTTVGGETALTETITRPTTGNWKYYVSYVLKGGKLYQMFTTAEATDDAVTKPTFDQILSTFTFTK